MTVHTHIQAALGAAKALEVLKVQAHAALMALQGEEREEAIDQLDTDQTLDGWRDEMADIGQRIQDGTARV